MKTNTQIVSIYYANLQVKILAPIEGVTMLLTTLFITHL